MAKTQDTENTKCWRECGATGALLHCWWEGKMTQPLSKTVWYLLRKLNKLLLYNPAITLLAIYPKDLKTWSAHGNLHTDVQSCFVHKCPNLEATKMTFISKWINWYIQKMEYHSALKKMRYQVLKRYGGILKTYYSVKGNLKGLHTVWFQLYIL